MLLVFENKVLMSLYFELLRKPVFWVEDVADRYKKIIGIRSVIKSLVQQSMTMKKTIIKTGSR